MRSAAGPGRVKPNRSGMIEIVWGAAQPGRESLSTVIWVRGFPTVLKQMGNLGLPGELVEHSLIPLEHSQLGLLCDNFTLSERFQEGGHGGHP